MVCGCCGKENAEYLCNDGCETKLCRECLRHFAWPDTGPIEDPQALGFMPIEQEVR